jgi:Flp pilus assembly pilin Flp
MGIVMRLITDERGADLVEYALLVGLLALASIAGLNGISATIKGIWQDMSTTIQNAF